MEKYIGLAHIQCGRSSKEGTTESALRLDQRTQPSRSSAFLRERMNPWRAQWHCAQGMISEADREGLGPAHFAPGCSSSRAAHYSRGWPELPSIINPSIAFCLPSSHHSPFWHFSSWAPSQTSIFVLVLIKEIDEKILCGCSNRGAEKGSLVLRKGYVAWKSHTDPKK